MLRAHSWHSNLTLARASTEAAPTSARAWIRLCGSYFESGGGAVRDNPFLDEAIEACINGATLAPYALNNPALLLVLKPIRCDITPPDWDGFQKRLETVQMSTRPDTHPSKPNPLMRH